MPQPNLKARFDKAYEHQDNPQELALDMLIASETYWEHHGCLEACTWAIYSVASSGDYAAAQGYAQWLYARLPRTEERMPCYKTLVEYAQGTLPYDELNRYWCMMNVLEAEGVEVR
ncbi:MAG: hypothetical protein AAGJ95_10410 [Cyanobacteria bacterium J06554_11]